MGYSPWGLKEVDTAEKLTNNTRLLGSSECWSWWGWVITVESLLKEGLPLHSKTGNQLSSPDDMGCPGFSSC